MRGVFVDHHDAVADFDYHVGVEDLADYPVSWDVVEITFAVAVLHI